ncbi:ATP-binding protein [Yinghuangia sp. ASG 101]|nr:ATP-binding protein [Yinghuangia sp. ASG 101]
MGLAAYRIVQEAVTNAVRHSGGSTVVVRLGIEHAADGDALRVTIEDDGRGASVGARPGAGGGTGGGHGLRNMRERASALGGTLATGPRAEGGYHVVAVLPLGGQDGGAPEAASPERHSA